MADPTNENAGGTPPEDRAEEAPEQAQPDGAEAQTQATPASEQPTQATPAAEAASAQDQAAAATAEQPTAVVPPAAAAGPAASGPSGPWYRRRWALIAGGVAAAAVLFLGGMAVGDAVWGDEGRDGFRGDHPGMFRDGDGGDRGFGQEGWGDSRGGQGIVPPGMNESDGMGHGHGWSDDGQGMGQGHGWDREDDRRGQDGCDDCPQAPDATPAPSTSPQAYYQ